MDGDEQKNPLVDSLIDELTETRKRLEAEKASHRRTESHLRLAREEWERTFDAIDDFITILAPDKRILRLNRAIAEAFDCKRASAVGTHCYKAFWDRDQTCKGCPTAKVLKDHKPHFAEFENHRVKKSFLVSASPIISPSGKLEGIVYVTKDITFKKKAEEKLLKAYDDLELKVKERTAELDFKSRHLEEANTALRMMLKAREEDRREIETRMMSNINRLIHPCIDQLRQTPLTEPQQTTVKQLEEHLTQILSPFATNLSSPVFHLTPREIQIANMVKNGKTNKEIAALVTVSVRAVEFHRENIRRKLGLTGSKANLRTHLMTFL